MLRSISGQDQLQHAERLFHDQEIQQPVRLFDWRVDPTIDTP